MSFESSYYASISLMDKQFCSDYAGDNKANVTNSGSNSIVTAGK